MIICPHCGQSLPDGTAFCSNCGAQVSSVQTPPPQNPYENPYSQMSQNPQQVPPQGAQQIPPQVGQQIPPQGVQQFPPQNPNVAMPGTPYGMPPQPAPSNGKAVASLVLGILSLLCLCLIFAGNALYMCVAILPGIIGLVLGTSARKTAKARGTSSSTANAGMVCSLVGLIIAALMGLIIVGIAIVLVATDSTDILDQIPVQGGVSL